MSHTYTSSLYHCVFSTKNREQMLSANCRERLWPYIGGIARKNRLKALAVGGVEDHLHILLSLPATESVAHAMQLIKGGSSKWVHDTYPTMRSFAWQEGYGAFSIGVSQAPATIAYIEKQKEHPRRRSFQEEFLAFLEKHGLAYDPRYVWG
jgi:REP element-mobilizing transposase RayT